MQPRSDLWLVTAIRRGFRLTFSIYGDVEVNFEVEVKQGSRTVLVRRYRKVVCSECTPVPCREAPCCG